MITIISTLAILPFSASSATLFAKKGDIIAVSIPAKNTVVINNYDINLVYDSTKLSLYYGDATDTQYGVVSKTKLPVGAWSDRKYNEKSNIIRANASSPLGVTVKRDQSVLVMYFEVTTNRVDLGSTALGIKINKFESYRISEDASSEKDVSAEIMGGVSLENYSKMIKFEIIRSDEQSSIMIGDVNFDGNISIDDVTLIQKHLATLIELEVSQLIAADTNSSQSVTIDDVTLIQKYLAQLISSLG